MSVIASIAESAIAERIMPGLVIYAEHAGQPLYHAAYGTSQYSDDGSFPIQTNTIYDLASLTKLFTATAILMLADTGELSLDMPAATYLPNLRAKSVTLLHLLTHSSGMDLRLSALRAEGGAAIRAAVYASEPIHVPGSYAMYTNLNSLLLGDIVARITGLGLDQVIQQLILRPLGMTETHFNPPEALHERIAPTEWDHEWRGGLVRGHVHDESTFALGGVAGHAGLFSTAKDMARFARFWLQRGSWDGRQLLREASVTAAWQDYTAQMRTPSGREVRSGLGWMRDRANFMGDAPLGSIGHTGFTGPALVLVPARDMFMLSLSNRTYPLRTPPPYRHHGVNAAMLTHLLSFS